MTEALKPSEVLDRAAALIEPEGAWTQGELAYDANGDWVHPSNPDAVCWCLVGSVARAAGVPSDGFTGHLYEMPPLAWVRTALRRSGPDAVWEFNDEPKRRQATVVETLRKAAKLARVAGQ